MSRSLAPRRGGTFAVPLFLAPVYDLFGKWPVVGFFGLLAVLGFVMTIVDFIGSRRRAAAE